MWVLLARMHVMHGARIDAPTYADSSDCIGSDTHTWATAELEFLPLNDILVMGQFDI